MPKKKHNKDKTKAIIKQRMKDRYDEIHSSIRLANSYKGDEIISLSNLDAFTSISIVASRENNNKNCNIDTTVNNDGNNNTNTNNNKDANLQVKCYASPLPLNIYKQCMDLFEKNMATLYKNSTWGLDLDLKEEELSHPRARFLIVTATSSDIASAGDSNGEIVVAFTHFRFECSIDECNENNYIYTPHKSNQHPYHDNEHESILYLYEIQIDKQIQRQSIGKKLMTYMQIIAMKMNMKKVMLTVFKFNGKAMDFYKKKLNYQLDESSPDHFDNDNTDRGRQNGIIAKLYDEAEEEVDYQILSKVVQINRS